MKLSATFFSGFVVLFVYILIAGCSTADGSKNPSTFIHPSNPPVASFTSHATNTDVPLIFQFTDQSSPTPDVWIWSFAETSGNNTEIVFSESQNPTLTLGAGFWLITLNCSNSAGYSTASLFWNVSYNQGDRKNLTEIQFFPSDYVWNIPVDNLPILPNSVEMIKTQNGLDGRVRPGFGFNGGGYALNIVDSSTARYVKARTKYKSPDILYAVPKSGVKITNGRSDGSCDTSRFDCSAIVIDLDKNIEYDFYGLEGSFYADGSLKAKTAAWWPLSDYTLYTDHGSALAIHTPHLAGQIRFEEIERGGIPHAIQIAIPYTRYGYGNYVWPADKSNSIYVQNTSTNYPRMGERLRLNASFNASGYSRANQIIIQAMKTYGMIVVDNGDLHTDRTYELRGIRDSRWNWTDLMQLSNIKGSDLEVIDESSLMMHNSSGQVRITSRPKPSITITPSLN